MLARAGAVAAPPLLGAVVIMAVAVLESAGLTPLTNGTPRNIAEAAGLGSGAEVVRLLRRGEQATRVLPVRPEILSSDVQQATALEAAVWSRSVELVRLLDDAGAIPAGERRRLACLARDLEVEDLIEYLDEDDAACTPGAVADEVMARTRGRRR